MNQPAEGSIAPDFELPADGGVSIRLSQLKGKIVVLYFYPKDDTSGCTTEAIDFTRLLPEFEAIGATVIGMSPDSAAKHDKFKAKHDLAVTLVADEDRNALEAYGVWVEKSMYGRKYMGVERSTFLIDSTGKIARIWRKVKVKGHAEDVLEAAREHGVQRFVFSSSIYVYSDQGSFYRTSKQACEHLIQDYHDRYGLEYTILRYGSLYGPRADKSNAVYKMVTSALEKQKIEYGGNGREVREYIHIRDAALMSADVLDDEFKSAILHLTGRERLTTGNMLEMLREMFNGNVEISLGTDTLTGHYMQTPYNYTPRLGRKMTRNTYIDLGLGLLDVIQYLDQANPETHPPVPSPEEGE